MITNRSDLHSSHVHRDTDGDGRCDTCTIPLGDSQPDALTVLRPGDRVLCVFRDANMEHIQNGLEQMRLRFPDVEFSALVGADQVLVQPSEEATT